MLPNSNKMAANSVNVWQVYFDEVSKANCYPEYNHYDNSERLTELFENEVIISLVQMGEHLKAKYFGVWSHDIKDEFIFKENGQRFSPEYLEELLKISDYPVIGFQKRRKNPNIIIQAEHYHPGFVAIMQKVLNITGYLPKIPDRVNNILLFNHFLMRGELYERYVNELLIPAVNALKEIPEAFNDAKYSRKRAPETEARFIKAFGKPYYPFHPFILERLPSLFLQKNKLTVKHLF
jgi:hypothetical protein